MWETVTSSSDLHGTHNTDIQKTSKMALDRWGLREEVTGSRVSRMGESRWMMVDSRIVVDRHGCPSGHPSGHLSRVRWQGFRLIDTRNECFGKRNSGGDPSQS